MSDDVRTSAADEAASIPPPVLTAPAKALPWTIYLWLAVIVAATLAPRIAERAGIALERPRVTKEVFTDTEFKQYVEAARNVRTAFADRAINARLKDKKLPTENLTTAKRGPDSLAAAIQQYRAMEKTSSVPNVSRVLLILERVNGKPLDEKRLTGPLTVALKESKKTPQEISAELTLWRILYGDEKTPAPLPPLAEQEKRVRDFDLHFLERRALTDLYLAYGDKAKAAKTQEKLDADAVAYRIKEGVVIVAVLGAVAVAIGVLVWTLRAALLRKWSEIGRIEDENPPLAPSWGTLIDGFAFFFAALLNTRFVVSGVTTYLLPNPDVKTVLALSVVGYLAPALLAIAYLTVTARREGATLAGIGLTKRNWGKNILYGIAGYCASLPFTLILALITRAIFRDNPDVTPNPIMPLITAERDFGGRFILFLLVAVAAPLVEEIFFRGVLQTGLRQRFGVTWAILLSALVFAIGHPLQDWIPIFGLGVAFAILRELRQSLVPGMVAHFLQNSMTFVALTTLFSN